MGEDNEHAVVGHPGRDELWMLSRTPTMDIAAYQGLLDRLRAKSCQLKRLQKTQQPATAPLSDPDGG